MKPFIYRSAPDVASTVARGGGRYRNSYGWFFRMQDGHAVAVTAFLDRAECAAVLANPRP